MINELNDVGMTLFDPQSAVAEFFLRKDRRFIEPTSSVYKDRYFVPKFFRGEPKF